MLVVLGGWDVALNGLCMTNLGIGPGNLAKILVLIDLRKESARAALQARMRLLA